MVDDAVCLVALVFDGGAAVVAEARVVGVGAGVAGDGEGGGVGQGGEEREEEEREEEGGEADGFHTC